VKILIAEDEVDIGVYYKMMLESRNHEVTLTRDGEECILAFEKAFHTMRSEHSSTLDNDPFDVVVLDSRMPKKDGVDVAKHILAVCSKQKIIFATAHTIDTLDALRKKINLGIEVLQKPFDLDVFVDMVEDIGQKRSGEQKSADSVSADQIQ
jgi:two-component system, cell cycle response regulator CpdR